MSSNQDSVIREANELLENAQKEVLREINKKKGFLAKLFIGKDGTEALKQVQSSISKAINQMKNLSRDESSIVVKLQSHLNEKITQIKKLELEHRKAEQEKEELADKLKNIQLTIGKLQNEAHNIEEEAKPNNNNDHKIEEDLKHKIQALEDTNKTIESKFILTKEDLSKSQALVVEFSRRMKRLKSEITSK